MASFENVSYISVVIFIAVFLANDLYAFISWEKMKKGSTERRIMAALVIDNRGIMW